MTRPAPVPGMCGPAHGTGKTVVDEVLDWRGRAVVDRNGQKIGTFEEIYLDEGTDEPAWAAVKAGTFGLRRSRVVPIAAAHSEGNSIRVPFTKQQVKTAPTIDSEGWVPERDQAAILRHYGVSGVGSRTGTERPETTTQETPVPEGSEPPEPTGREGSAAPAGDNQPNGMKLKAVLRDGDTDASKRVRRRLTRERRRPDAEQRLMHPRGRTAR